MKFPDFVHAVYIKRGNRFTADVRLEGGGARSAFIPTTGRLTGVLTPGCRVWLEPVDNPRRKTPFNLVLAELPGGGLCSINAMLANSLFNEAVKHNRLEDFLYTAIKNEVPYGRSRLDFRLLKGGEDVCWVEIKSVTYAREGVGMFPDAPTSRGRKHLGELAKLAACGKRASVVFIAQREDVSRFAPYETIDPAFAVTLRQAHNEGVEVHAYRCKVSLEEIKIAEKIPTNLLPAAN